MKAQTYKISKKQHNSYNNSYNVFPKNRDFYFLDYYEKIKDFKTTNFDDPEYICVISEDKEKKIKENIYLRKDFLNDYEFIKVIYKNLTDGLNFIIAKNRINIGGSETRFLTEIKIRPLIMKEIYRRAKINLNSNENIIFKQEFSVPNDQKFFNRILKLHIQKSNFNDIPPNQTNNTANYNNNNINNNGYNNNANNNGNNIIVHNLDNNMSNNQSLNNNYHYNNNFTAGIYNNGNNNINNYNNSIQQNNNNLIYNNYNSQSGRQNSQQNNGSNLNSKTNIDNINQNNINSLYNYKEYIINSNQINAQTNISNNQNNINGINNKNQVYNQFGYPPQQGNSYGKLNANPSYQTHQGVLSSKSGEYPPQPGSNNFQPGSNNPQQGSNNFRPGTNNSQPGPNNSQPGPNNSQQGSNNSQPGFNNSQQGKNNSQDISQKQNQQNFSKPNYLFSKKGLKNIGSTCYMNATLQCLLHVNELVTYFIEEYPKDQQQLAKINNDVASGGDISRAFYNLVIGVNENSELVMSKKNLKQKTKKKSGFNILGVFGFDNDYDDSSYDRAFAPTDFKRTLGIHNPQFKKFEANDSKDLILYLLQTMHEELNYYGNVNKRLKYIPNQYNIYETYNHFITNYNTNNFSKISLLFYGTYQNTTTCLVCHKKLYNFQKFEFISFGMYYYHKHRFNILNGFQDNANPTILKGDNKFLCNNCKKLQDAKTECKIFEPPLKLLINLDYGKNKKYQPSSIEFDEEIDITKFVEFDYKQKIRYRIIGVCTHYGHSGSYGHYVAFCRNTQTDTWYEFNDSFCSECNKREIYRGSPYLLLYERIFN